jgi:hypothetical protein
MGKTMGGKENTGIDGKGGFLMGDNKQSRMTAVTIHRTNFTTR